MVTKKVKMAALFFVLLMFGSTFAYAILNALTGQGSRIQIPRERILNYELNEQQKRYLRSRGFTLIEHYSSPGCMECISVRNKLEYITQNSEDQVYLQELTGEISNKVVITSLNGQKILNNPTNEEIENAVCDLLLRRPLWCVTSQI
jgi:hypothetical protein